VSKKGYKQVVKLLLKKGANINTDSRKYSIRFFKAPKKGYKQILKLLLQKGANINI
jgi:ankyrin repeat protein